jgi:hypothetical protein
MRPFAIEAPWAVVHVDLMEMAPSSEGHRYALVVRCGSSGYLDVHPLMTKDKKETLRALFESYSHYGLPGTTVMDHGGEFQNLAHSEFQVRMKIIEAVTTP